MGDRTYVEPFAGGFGIGIRLLYENVVKFVVINDIDPHIYHLWYAVLYQREAPITMNERKLQKIVYGNSEQNALHDGFATLFLNRVNFSGVIKGGPIGGVDQKGKYKIDCRFNKEDIIRRIQKIAEVRDCISLYNCDASELISIHLREEKHTSFFNIDPPYVIKGSSLYTNYFLEEDHRSLKRVISENLQDVPWVMTYDDCDLIHTIYEQYHIEEYNIQYDIGKNARRKELVITNLSAEQFVW